MDLSPGLGGKVVKHLNEPVRVETRLRPDGELLPLAFHWQNRRLDIESWGRERVETDNEQTVRCFLVQTHGPETWELCYHKNKAQWVLTRHWAAKYRIV